MYFTNFPEFGSFRVHEGEVSTVELMGAFNSLDVLGFGQRFNLGFSGFGQVGSPTVAFTNPSTTPALSSSEPRLAAEVPEPSAGNLMAAALLLLSAFRLQGRVRKQG